MNIPLSTYRLQFNKYFTFNQASEILNYLSALGISHIYASPIFKARKGSSHGYDIVDPCRLNPELGNDTDFRNLIEAVKNSGLSWLQDIVPNHMAYSSENEFIMDIFEKGKFSKYYHFFDINWDHFEERMRGRVLAPFLGSFYAYALENSQIQLKLSEKCLSANYYNFCFPLRIGSYVSFLELSFSLIDKDDTQTERINGLINLFKSLRSIKSADEYQTQVEIAKSNLWDLYINDPFIKTAISAGLKYFNGEKGNPRSFDALDKLLEDQLFRFSYWKVSAEEIDYRRFFTVNELISVRIEDQKVFDALHSLIFRLVNQDFFNGLRIDHIDGLYEPEEYLNKVKAHCPDVYVTVEKILARGEKMPSTWPIQGNTGYDFINYLNGIFCQQKNGALFTAIYSEFIKQDINYEDMVADKKRSIISKHLAGNIDCLANHLKNISKRDRYGRDITIYGIKRALVEVLSFFPVYRTYVKHNSASQNDLYYLAKAIIKAKEKLPGYQNEINFIAKYLLLYPDETVDEETQQEARDFIMQFQQYTAPVMAKGFEDTVLYVYNRLISLNEVGSDPETFGYSLGEFHNFNQIRVKDGTESFNASSTHDTKRGEDVRARINVISEIPKEWIKRLNYWSQLNQYKKTVLPNKAAPDRNDEIFFYQTLIGAMPFSGPDNDFLTRMKDYVIKVVREAKRHTAWIKPDEEYERACLNFIDKIMDGSNSDNRFLISFLKFHNKISFYGVINSLSQTVLKITSPGVADFYQGTELWDFSLVDPDNRRTVDFNIRKNFLNEIKQSELNQLKFIKQLLSSPQDGKIKLFTAYHALQAKKKYPELFRTGDYIPLQIKGTYKNNIISFSRKNDKKRAVIVAPRFLTEIINEGQWPLGYRYWHNTYLNLNESRFKNWLNIFTGEILRLRERLYIGEVFEQFPVAVLISE